MSEHAKSDSFEHELDEFFKERALFRTQTVADTAKNKVSKERYNEDTDQSLFGKSPDARRTNDGSMSGCCMTGCHDCPWEYSG